MNHESSPQLVLPSPRLGSVHPPRSVCFEVRSLDKQVANYSAGASALKHGQSPTAPSHSPFTALSVQENPAHLAEGSVPERLAHPEPVDPASPGLPGSLPLGPLGRSPCFCPVVVLVVFPPTGGLSLRLHLSDSISSTPLPF